MKNKKLIMMGIIIAMIMCVVVGCGNSNNETVETVAMVETEEPATAEEVEETPQPVEEAPAVEESVEKEEEKEEASDTKEVEISATEDTIETTEADYTKEAEELWGVHSEEFECNYETFRENYTEEREGGSDKETAYETVYNILKKVEENVIVKDYEILSIDPTTMYALQASNIRKGPSTDYEKVGSLVYGEEVTVIGKVETEGNKIWYVLESNNEDEVQMVSGSLLSTTKPQPVVQNNNTPSTTNTQPQVDTAPVNSAGALSGLPGAANVPNVNIQWNVGFNDASSLGDLGGSAE